MAAVIATVAPPETAVLCEQRPESLLFLRTFVKDFARLSCSRCRIDASIYSVNNEWNLLYLYLRTTLHSHKCILALSIYRPFQYIYRNKALYCIYIFTDLSPTPHIRPPDFITELL